MPLTRCQFCTAQPLREVAVARWRDDPDDVERLTIELCAKHLQRLNKAGQKGHKHLGQFYKVGFW
jgi:hypothetical protein